MANSDNNNIIGKTFRNKLGHQFIVLEKTVDNYISNNSRYKIRFIITGYEKECNKGNILLGEVKDKLMPSVYGIGIIGLIKITDFKKEYFLWANMLARCYNKKFASYKSYGGKGVTVSKRWHLFTNFLEDIKTIDGYDDKKFHKGLLELDKDTKQMDKPYSERVYSLDTCMFISKKENLSLSDLDPIKTFFKAISPEGRILYRKGILEFCREYSYLNHSNIASCLNKLRNNHKGWRFIRITEKEYYNWVNSNHIIIYRKDNCNLNTKKDREIFFKVVSPDGLVLYRKGIINLCKEYPELNHKNISACIKNGKGAHKGWKFKKITQSQYELFMEKGEYYE